MRQSPSNAPMAPEDGTTTFHFEDMQLKRLTAADIVAGVGTLAVLVSLFLPWYTATINGLSVSLTGTAHHKFLWLAVLLSVVIITYLIVHAMGAAGTRIAREPVLLGLSVVQLILVVVPFFYIPVAETAGVTVGMAYGAWLGLIAGIASVIAAIVPFARSLGQR